MICVSNFGRPRNAPCSRTQGLFTNFGWLIVGSGPWAGLPGPVWGQVWPYSECERTEISSQIVGAEGPGSLELDFGPFALHVWQKTGAAG